MKEFIQNYRSKPWPKLEIPTVGKPQLVGLTLFIAALIAGGLAIWFSGGIRAEKFILLGLAIPVLLFLKNKWVTIVGLLSFQVIVAFLFIGNSDYALMAVGALIGTIIAFESPVIMYMILITTIWFFYTGYTFAPTATMKLYISGALFTGWIFREIMRPIKLQLKVDFPEKAPVILLFIWTTIGYSLWCLDPVSYGWAQYRGILVSIVLFLITPLVIRRKKDLYPVLWIWIIVGIIGSAVSFFVQPEFGTTAASASGLDILVAAKNPTATIFCLSFFIIFPVIYWGKQVALRLLALISILLIGSAVVFLQSRAAVIGLTAGIILFWIVDMIWNPKRKSSMRILVRVFLIFSFIVISLIGIYGL